MFRIDFRGTGMGQSSSKKIADGNDGKDSFSAGEGQGDNITVRLLILPQKGAVKNVHIGLVNTAHEEIVHMINVYNLLDVNPEDCTLVVYCDEALTVLERSTRMERYRSTLMSDAAIIKLIHKPTLGVSLK